MINIKSYDFYYHLRKLLFVEAIWLYGSRARNDAYNTSDIDLAIICPKATEEDWQIVNQIVVEADTLFEIDLVRFDRLTAREQLYQNILTDHIVLFERKKNDYNWYESFLELGEAIDQLEEMILIPEVSNSYVRDATIQRFEFCLELFWKTLKKICITEQFYPTSPKQVFQFSFEIGLITDSSIWRAMLEDRNLLSHTYQRILAHDIYYKIDKYYKYMNQAYLHIKQKYSV